MVLTPSTMLPLGTPAPDFALPDTKGKTVSLKDFAGAKALLVMFICNHCPYVKHLRKAFVNLAKDYAGKGLQIVAINSNDVNNYPEDSPAMMAREVAEQGYTFPYLFDETQEVAKAYKAACTPDLFLFDAERRLVYRGQWDDSRPGNDKPITGADIRAAIDATLQGKVCSARQIPSMGCNIKWKPGAAPSYT